MSDPVEQLIREQFARDADLAPTPHGLADAARRRARRGPRVVTHLVVAAALVVILGGGGLWLHANRSAAPVAVNGPAAIGGPAVAVAPEPGKKYVSYHGITLQVPETFQVGPVFCSAPTVDSVVPDTGQAASCPAQFGSSPPAPTDITIVSLGSDDSGGNGQLAAVASRPTTVDGHPATTGSGHVGGDGPVTVLHIPAVGVLISVSSPDSSMAAKIFATVKVVATDPLGCAQQIAGFQPAGNPPAATLVPGTPTSGVVCEYLPPAADTTSSWLAGSATLSQTDLELITKVADRLKTHSPTTSDAAWAPFAWYRLTFADGQERTIAATLNYQPAVLSDGVLEGSTVGPAYPNLPGAFGS